MSAAEELFARAVAAHQANDLDAAERDYRQILATKPDHAASLTNLGVLLVRRGRFDEAERFYAAALATNPDLPDIHFNLGNLLRRRGRLAEAAAAFEAALRIAP